MRRALRWIADRFGFHPIWDHILDRQVPKDPWYHGDGMALLVLLTVLIFTGGILALGYCPAMDEAYRSVDRITHEQYLGWFVRGLHYWSSGVMVVMLFLHFCRQILLGGYKAPREATWMVGVLLMFLVLATSLFGYILRWDLRGHAGLRVVLSALQHTPFVGDRLVYLLQGGPEITSLTLSRLFAAHVLLIPLALLVLVTYHMYLVILQGTTTVGERKEPIETVEEQRELYQEQAYHPVKGEVFFPTAVIKIAPWSVAALALVVGLTLYYGPRELVDPAAELTSGEVREEWWFAWYSALVALLPPRIARLFHWLFPLVLFILLLLVPILDRSPHRGWRRRPIALTVVILLILSVLGLSWMRYQSPWTPVQNAAAPNVPQGFILTSEAEAGRQLFARYSCNACHAVGHSGSARIGPDLARLPHFLSQEELRQYILQPPRNVAMPAYRGRLSEEELHHVVAFVLVAQSFPRQQE